MKNPVSLFLVLLALLSGCRRQDVLQTGDLIFVGIPADYQIESDSMDAAIVDATGGESLNLIHVAIAEVEDGQTWIIDATIKHGVDRHPLDTFLTDFTLKDGSYPVFQVRRLRDPHDASRYVDNAKKYIGQPYDIAFLPDNGAYYCSELVQDSYTDGSGTSLFQARPMNFRNADGDFPLYWQQLFDRLGMPIPQDIPGTNPQMMAEEPVLVPVDVAVVPHS